MWSLLTIALAADVQSADRIRWQNRLVVIVADSPRRTELDVSVRALARRPAEARDRLLHLVTIVDDDVTGLSDSADTLRKRWSLSPSPFEALLIGLDGEVKARTHEALDPDAWFTRIDAMPMRASELRQRSD